MGDQRWLKRLYLSPSIAEHFAGVKKAGCRSPGGRGGGVGGAGGGGGDGGGGGADGFGGHGLGGGGESGCGGGDGGSGGNGGIGDGGGGVGGPRNRYTSSSAKAREHSRCPAGQPVCRTVTHVPLLAPAQSKRRGSFGDAGDGCASQRRAGAALQQRKRADAPKAASQRAPSSPAPAVHNERAPAASSPLITSKPGRVQERCSGPFPSGAQQSFIRSPQMSARQSANCCGVLGGAPPVP